MVELPRGIVALLFSDIEGSTDLAQRLGDEWPRALDLHRSLCREAWRRHRGAELGTEGDSFFVVFSSARDAVSAAIDAQRSLAAADWPQGSSVRVRMGIHTGAPDRHGDGYVGVDVHRAARVAAAAHGGQVLVTETTAALVQPDPPGGAHLVDLGEHRLKDLPERVRLLRLSVPGLPEVTAPPRTTGGVFRVPDPLTPIVGRDHQLVAIAADLARDARLVTLTGPGGAGKTRLAIAAAERTRELFADGSFFVPLQDVTRTESMWVVTGQALGLPADGYLPPAFFEYTRELRCLVVLDNVEQIDGADAVVRQLLAEAQQLRVLVTSRRPLHVQGEREHVVSPLDLPPRTADVAEIETSGAVQMFCACAKRVNPHFTLDARNASDVAALCAQLDALPLAIELAASRIKVLPPRAILNRIHQVLDVKSLDRRSDARHHTVRATVDWSYGMLAPAHQRMLEHLAVFEGGADLDGIEAVMPPDLLDGDDPLETVFELVDSSLVVAREAPNGEPRFSLLEMIKRYAHEKLTARGDLPAALRAHSQHYFNLANELCRASRGPRGTTMSTRARLEIGNLAALVQRAESGVELDGLILQPSVVQAVGSLALDFLDQVHLCLTLTEDIRAGEGPSHLCGVAGCHSARANALHTLGRIDAAMREGRDAADLALRLIQAGEEDVVPRDFVMSPRIVHGIGLYIVATSLRQQGRSDEAEQVIEHQLSVSRDPATPPFVRGITQAAGLAIQAELACDRGDFDQAIRTIHEIRDLVLSNDDDWGLVAAHTQLADVELRRGDLAAAEQHLEPVVGLPAAFDSTFLASWVGAYLAMAVSRRDPILAGRLHGAIEAAQVAQGVISLPDGYDESMSEARSSMPEEIWESAVTAGRGQTIFEALEGYLAARPVPDQH